MSVIMRNLAGNGVSGGTSKGFPPGDVTNVSIKSGTKSVIIRFSDPDDTIEGTTTLSTWKSTILIRKEGSAPTSIKDGTIVLTNTERNKYKDTQYEDITAEVGKTYYYRFYTLSTDKVYNDSSDMIYSIKVILFDPVLKNNTWEQIAGNSEAGNIPSTWNIGDEIDLTLSGTYNETVTLQIWDFNHFDKSDGSGKAGICFGMKYLMKDAQIADSSNKNYTGWNDSYMRNTVMVNILNSMPSNLQSYIKEVNTYAATTNNSDGLLCKDKIFIPGFKEVGYTSQYINESGQSRFSLFNSDDSRIKKMNNGNNSANDWWLRSIDYNGRSGNFFVISERGSWNASYPEYARGICFCFNV